MENVKYYFDTIKRGVLTAYHHVCESERFIELNDEQRGYFLNHRTASYDMIWYCGNIPVPPRTLDIAKREKLSEIEFYDISENVNGFYLNGNLVWLDRDTRASLKNTIESATLMGRESLNIWFNDVYVTLPLETTKTLLATLELYATDCYNVTAQHKVEVKALTTIEDVDNYDITLDYPEKLSFDING